RRRTRTRSWVGAARRPVPAHRRHGRRAGAAPSHAEGARRRPGSQWARHPICVVLRPPRGWSTRASRNGDTAPLRRIARTTTITETRRRPKERDVRRLRDLLEGLFASRRSELYLERYVLREHAHGRQLDDILN